MAANFNWYAADFETAADEDNINKGCTYVWAWGITKISEKDEVFYYGTDILSFVGKTLELGGTYWFHNEKFDGSFILSFLLSNGFTYTDKNSFDMPDYSYNVVVNGMGQIYKICYKVNNKLVKVQNSLLKIPGTIRSIAKSLKLPLTKGDIDYHNYRQEGANDLDPVDKDYLERDVRILAKAMYSMHLKNGNKALTIGADCMKAYKKFQSNYNTMFPELNKEIDSYIRKSYRGGYTWCRYPGIKVKAGTTFDKNSMYPGVMHSSSGYLFPYGRPKYFKGSYTKDSNYPIYIQRIRVTARLKENRWPTINLGCGFSKSGHSEYATEIDNQELTLTDVDLLWLFRNYDVTEYEDIDGYKFKVSKGMFDDYINTYMKLKEEATKNRDPVQRQLAKLMLNNLYGKFGTNPERISKLPVLIDGRLKWLKEADWYKLKGQKEGKVYLKKFNNYNQTGYIPVATFCTAYARNELWKAMEVLWDYFLYCDTDSLHILIAGLDIALSKLNVHDTKLGAWARESNWIEGIFIRAKTYAENQLGKWTVDEYGDRVFKPQLDGTETNWDIKCAGMPESLKSQIDIADFKIGSVWVSDKYLSNLTDKERNKFLEDNKGNLHVVKKEGKLMPKQVKGGTILVEVPFKINE